MSVKVYTVNGATAGSASSLPDWLVHKKKGKGRREIRDHVEGTVELIQGFEFPEASIRVRTTRDGQHIIATGTYKPQIRVWDVNQLSLKFERHSDAENVDFVTLSDDWTKSIHLQNDRSIELHTQGGFHYRTRIPRFGRAIAYHFPSCDTYVSASGNDVYRLNLAEGRFMSPLTLEADEQGEDIIGINVIDINPAHGLLSFGVDGNGTVQFWDPRSRSKVGLLRAPRQSLLSTAAELSTSIGITAISSRSDGLSYAVGTSTGHTLLYDIRTSRPFAQKDQGYGLPVENVCWIDGDPRMAGDGLVLSADKKVIKIWDRDTPRSNFVSITPSNDLNHVHHIPGSGLIMTANEGIQMGIYYVPQLGPAPKWASFLENITEEMEDQNVRNVYEDFKFVERNELKILGLEHLIGTPTLKPYMHGYFISLKLYDTARLIANPFIYAEHREKVIKDKLDKLAETRIRTRKNVDVKVNKALAEKVLREEEKAKKREERKKRRIAEEAEEGAQDVEMEESSATNILSDPRFAAVFADPSFQVDETSREFALLNPSTAARKTNTGKTAVEIEDEQGLKNSSDDDDDEESDDDDGGSDSSDAGELTKFDPRSRPGQRNERMENAYARQKQQNRTANVPLVPMEVHVDNRGTGTSKNLTFGDRKRATSAKRTSHEDNVTEMTWVPTNNDVDTEDRLVSGGGPPRKDNKASWKRVESFGAGLERGGDDVQELSGTERHGRTQRRKGVRSGSKNVFRRIEQ